MLHRVLYCRLGLALAVLWSGSSLGYAQPQIEVKQVAAEQRGKRPITVEDVWSIKRLGRPSVSPDGRWVVVEVTTYDMDKNDSTSDLWLFATDGSSMRQLTTHPARDSQPAWSPDGQWIAFLSKREDDTAQIYLIRPDGGEARPLSKLPSSVTAFKWAPDGKTIYCIANTWPDTPDDESHRRRDQERKESKVQAAIIESALFRYWDRWLTDGQVPMLFSLDVATGKHRNLLAGLNIHLVPTSASEEDFDIAPDQSELCFVADSSKEYGREFNSDIYTLSLDGQRTLRNLTADNLGNDFSPRYSPDGRYLAYLRQTTRYFYADRQRIMIYNRATKQHKEITASFDRSCVNPLWTPDSKHLYFEAEDQGYVRLYRVRFDGQELEPITSQYSDRAAALSRDGRCLVFLRSHFGLPPTLMALHLPGRELKSIDALNRDLVKQWSLGVVDEVWFPGAEDRPVQMWVVYPPNFDKSKRWPLIQIIHGGPHNAITNEFHFRWPLHLFASKGYVVACVNFHGSSGFGQEFTDSITGDLASKPYRDIMKATDYLEQLPYIDKNRMAAAGASYGGYMIAWINGHTDRFRCLVCHAGVYNWHSMMASDILKFRERALGAPPWENMERVDRQSPQRFSFNFRTPTLISHGEKDYRVPVTQGFEFYNTLKQKGIPTRLIYFPDENHWILKPQNSRLWFNEVFAWLDRHIGHGPEK
ncbi:MAG: S9 family peptidase [Gemmatales bacterium]|nr:S9 family peptidase [Gemmatales bacterium]MDW7993031.1 S9 family peptidase [Gemmatales bacterium]